MQSKQYWRDWFLGLTNQFLDVKIAKVLLLAEKERMDKDLTIANMQGRFRLNVLHNVGHCMHEDDPLNTARQLHLMITSFRVPVSISDS